MPFSQPGLTNLLEYWIFFRSGCCLHWSVCCVHCSMCCCHWSKQHLCLLLAIPSAWGRTHVRCTVKSRMCSAALPCSETAGLAIEFSSEKILRNRIGMVLFFNGRKSAFWSIWGLRKSQFRSLEQKGIILKNLLCSSKQNWECVFVRKMLQNRIPRVCF